MLWHWQCIHICAQSDHLAAIGLATIDNANKAGFSNACNDLVNTKFLK